MTCSFEINFKFAFVMLHQVIKIKLFIVFILFAFSVYLLFSAYTVHILKLTLQKAKFIIQ